MVRIDEVSKEWMLRAAHRLTARQHKRGVPLWSWVGAICCTGSGSAHTICREYGWDPSAPADCELPLANALADGSAIADTVRRVVGGKVQT